MKLHNVYLLSLLTILLVTTSMIGLVNYMSMPVQFVGNTEHNQENSNQNLIYPSHVLLKNSTYNIAREALQILYVYDPTSGYPVYKDDYMALFNHFSLNVTYILKSDLNSIVSSSNSISLIILGPSVGGVNGASITYSDAKQIFSYHVPLLLLGSTHGLIDRLEDIDSSKILRTTISFANVTDAFIKHQITTKPYQVELNQSLIQQAEMMDYYIAGAVPSLEPIVQDNTSKIIGGYYHSNLLKKIIWLSFENATNLSISGEAFLINTIVWLSYKSRLSIISDYVSSLQILSNPLYIGFGGFGFPFSPLISATYYYLRISELLNLKNEIDVNRTVNFLLSCYNSTEGSFSDLETETDSSISKVWTTGLAMYILNTLNESDVVNTTQVAIFLASAQDVSGGFKDNFNADSSTINIRNTFAALYGLSILDPNFLLINKTASKNYILSLQVTDTTSQDYGGFKDSSDSYQASVYATFYALRSLELLNEKSSVDLSAVSTFINNNEQADGSFTDKINLTPAKATAVAVWLLFDIGRLDSLDNFTNTLTYMKSMQNPDGGFGLYVGDLYSELKDTYFAILGLSSIGNNPNDMNGLRVFLESTKSLDGGNSKTRLWGSVWTTYNALAILNLTGSLFKINQTALEIYLNSTYFNTKGYFYWTSIKDGLYNAPPELNYLLIPSKGIPMTYFAINSLDLANLTKLKNETVSDVSSAIISSEITDNANQFYGMYSYIPYPSLSLINVWNTRYEFVFWATETLALLGNLSDITDILATRIYLNDCYAYTANSYPEAQFLNTLPLPYNVSYNLASTYFALSVLSNIGGINNTILVNARNRVNENLNYSDVASVFFALKIKNIIKQYNSTLSDSIVLNKTAILELLKNNQLPEGIFKGDIWSGYWLVYTRMALDILKELRLTALFDETLFIDANVTILPNKDQYLLGGTLSVNANSSVYPLHRNETLLLQVYLNDTLEINQTFYNDINVSLPLNNSSFLGNNSLVVHICGEEGNLLSYEYIKSIMIITELNITVSLDKTYYYSYEHANITVVVNSSSGILVDDALVTANLSGTINQSYILSNTSNGTYISSIPLSEYEGSVSVLVSAQKPFAVPDNETISLFIFNSTTKTLIASNCTELSWGDSIHLQINITNNMETVNGTALVILDGQSLDNISITNGDGYYDYTIPNYTPLGLHNISVVFGLYDDPNKYTTSEDCALFNVTLRPLIEGELSNDTIYATDEMQLTAKTTYNNASVGVWLNLEIRNNNTEKLEYNTTTYGPYFSFNWKPNAVGTYTIELSIIENETIKPSTLNFSLTVLKVPTEITLNASDVFEMSSGITINTTFFALNQVDSAPVLIYRNGTLVNILTISENTEINIPVEKIGMYNITLLYLGNETYVSSKVTHFVRVIITPYFEVTYTPSEIYTTNITEFHVFTLYSGENITSLIDVTVVNIERNLTLLSLYNTSAPCTFSTRLYLNGSYLIILTLHGNETVIGSNSTYELTVYATPTNLQILSPTQGVALNNFTVTLNLTTDVGVSLAGNIRMYVNNTYYETVFAGSTQPLSLMFNSSGVYNLTFVYFGNFTYSTTYSYVFVTIKKVSVNINMNISNVDNIIMINVTSTAQCQEVDKNITLIAVDPLGKIVLNKTLRFGNHSISLIPYILGNYNISLTFSGGTTYSSVTSFANITIEELPVLSFIYGRIETANNSYFCGQQINITLLILLHNYSASYLSLNVIPIHSNFTLTRKLSVSNGSLLITLISPGIYNVTLWAINNNSSAILLDSVNLNAEPLPVNLSFVNLSKHTYYSEETINVTLYVNSSQVSLLAGNITVEVNQTLVYTVSFKNGFAILYLSSLSAGNYTLMATISGANYTSNPIYTNIHVMRTPTKILCEYNNPNVGDNLVLKIDLLSMYDRPIAGKIINITIIQRSTIPSYIFRETSPMGYVTFATPVLNNGTIDILITFDGDSMYLSSNKTIQIIVSSNHNDNSQTLSNEGDTGPTFDSQVLITGIIGLTGATITTIIFVYKKTVKPILRQFNVRK